MPENQHFLTLTDYSADQINNLLNLALSLKQNPTDYTSALAGKSVAMIFEKPSLRTRVSFDIGIHKLGGHCVYLDQQNGAFGKRETVTDFAKNLSCWADGIVARVFSHSDLKGLQSASAVPVINGLCDIYHPCQALADLLTLKEHFNDLSTVKLAWIGDGNNVCHSLMLGIAIMGGSITVITPEGRGPDAHVLLKASEIAKESGASITLSHDPSASKHHDAVYTDTWLSMGDSSTIDDIWSDFSAYQVNQSLFEHAGASVFMHCQPAHRGQEVTADVLEGPHSVILQQAENRMHAQNAVLITLLGDIHD